VGRKDDPLTGLPDDLGIGEDLSRAEQRLRIRKESRRYGKPVTIVEGFDPSAIDMKSVASRRKKRVGVGGTVEGDAIELQGDHVGRLPEVLEDEGFEVEG
jgi:translation initiation factor 1